MKNSLLPTPKPVCPPPSPTEAAILKLARTQNSFNRLQLEAQLDADGVTACYQSAIDKCIEQGDIEERGSGVWRSLICRVVGQ